MQTHGGRHPLPDWVIFTDKITQMGISSAVSGGDVSTVPKSATQVVIYDDSRFAFAARLWWMLRYMGHEQVAILDGGIRAWTVAGLALSQEMPEPKAGAFNPSLQSELGRRY